MKAVPVVLSNNILMRGEQEKIKITPMKLQKILYYVCVKFVQSTNEMPISEMFEVWKYGPVLPSVYSEFKPFGGNHITDYARNSKRIAMIVDEDENPTLVDCINYVWTRGKNMSGVDLARRTHQKGSGWYSAFQRDSETISLEEMKNDTTF